MHSEPSGDQLQTELRRFADSIMSGHRRLTAEEVTAAAGMDLEVARRLRRAMGLPDVPDTEPVFFDDDVDALRRARTLLDEGLSVPDLLHLARTLGLAASRMADSVVEFWTDRVATPGSGMLEPDRFDDLERVVGYLLRRHLLDAVTHRLSATVDSQLDHAVAVGFADLVGFTSLSEQLDDRQTSELIEQFELLGTDVIVGGGGRVVKMIGDEVMFMAEPGNVGEIALSLAETFDAPELPAVRVGVASGSVVRQAGDLYGPVVNLASRATMAARPGTVLVGPALAEVLRGDARYAVVALRPRRLKGIGPVELCVLRRATAPGRTTVTRRAG